MTAAPRVSSSLYAVRWQNRLEAPGSGVADSLGMCWRWPPDVKAARMCCAWSH